MTNGGESRRPCDSADADHALHTDSILSWLKNDKTLKRLHNSFEGIPMQDFPLEAGDIGLVVPRCESRESLSQSALSRTYVCNCPFHSLAAYVA